MHAVLSALVALLLLAQSPAPEPARELGLHPFDLPQPAVFPAELLMLVEIPAEGRIKYEIDPASGRLFVDRFLQTPMRYPANYGSVPSTLAGDGDPLDALVFTREALMPGVLIRVRALALLRMTDSGEEDAKLIAVPARGVDASYAGVERLEDLGALERERIRMFFEEYKRLPGGAAVEVGGFEPAEAARAALVEARERHRRARAEPR